MRYILPFLLVLYLNPTNAQSQHCDSLYFTNGEAVLAEVLAESSSIIRYTVCGDTTQKQFEVKSMDVKSIRHISLITVQSKENHGTHATKSHQKSYKNLFLFGFSPLADSGRKKYHAGYAGGITKHLAIGLDYTYFDLESTSLEGFLFTDEKIVKRRTGYELAISGRFYFKSCLFKGFYLKPGVSYTAFKGSKYVKKSNTTFPDPDNPGSGVHTAESWQSAQVLLYSIILAPGYTLRIKHISLDLNAGLRPGFIKFYDVQNNYTYESLPVFFSLSLGLAL